MSKCPEKVRADTTQASLHKRYRTILAYAEKELPVIPPKSDGKRGKLAKSDAHNWWDRLKQHEAAVLRFASDPQVAFTNNRAKQDFGYNPLIAIQMALAGNAEVA